MWTILGEYFVSKKVFVRNLKNIYQKESVITEIKLLVIGARLRSAAGD